MLDQTNLDLRYAMYFNLANAFHRNQMYDEALSTYKYVTYMQAC